MSGTSSTQQQRPRREAQPIIYSLCIPRVFKNITEKRVRAIFYSLKLGFVERVDMVAKTSPKGEEFWRVFIHFSNWNERNSTAVQMREKLDAGEKIKIVYDDPWFWLISKSSAPRPEQYERQSKRPAPFIDFGHTAPAPAQSPGYTPTDRGTPRSPSPSPDYGPRSPSPEPTMPQRENTVAMGDPDYQEELN